MAVASPVHEPSTGYSALEVAHIQPDDRNLEQEHLNDKEVAKVEGIEVVPLDGIISTKDDEKELYTPPADMESANGNGGKQSRMQRRVCGIPLRIAIGILVFLVIGGIVGGTAGGIKGQKSKPAPLRPRLAQPQDYAWWVITNFNNSVSELHFFFPKTCPWDPASFERSKTTQGR